MTTLPTPSPTPWDLTGHGRWATPDTNPHPDRSRWRQVPLVLPLSPGSQASWCPPPSRPQGRGGGVAGASVPHIPCTSPVHSVPSPSSVQGPVRHHSQPLALQGALSKGSGGDTPGGAFPLHASHPHEPVQPYWGLSGGTPSFVHNLCGCPHPVATSPHAALLQCQTAPTCVPGSPAANTGKSFSSSLSLHPLILTSW